MGGCVNDLVGGRAKKNERIRAVRRTRGHGFILECFHPSPPLQGTSLSYMDTVVKQGQNTLPLRDVEEERPTVVKV